MCHKNNNNNNNNLIILSIKVVRFFGPHCIIPHGTSICLCTSPEVKTLRRNRNALLLLLVVVVVVVYISNKPSHVPNTKFKKSNKR